MTIAAAQEAARKGASFLDDNFPGWVDRVNLDSMEMARPGNCVLCQVTDKKTYYGACVKARIPVELSRSYGFDSESNSGSDDTDYDYHDLDAAWQELIRERRATSTPTEITLTREDLELFMERLDEMEDDSNTLESVTFNIDGVKVSLA